jgi:hypothetical protein
MKHESLVPVLGGLIIALGAAVCAAATPPVVLSGVPDYGWNYGCGPTAAGMVIAYWDRKGFGQLVDYRDAHGKHAQAPLDDALVAERPAFPARQGWNQGHGDLQIDRLIASEGHGRDYWDYGNPACSIFSLGVDPLLDRHADDSLADYLRTSRGPFTANGSTWPFDVAGGLRRFSEARGYTQANGFTVRTGCRWFPSFEEVGKEIGDGRPILLLLDLRGYWVDTNWHYVTVYGCEDAAAQGQWIAVRDTWKNDNSYAEFHIENRVADGIRWWKWNADLMGARAAVRAMFTYSLERRDATGD